MIYKCFIIDDESHAIETLKKYALDSGQLEIVGTSQNPLQAIQLINEHKDIDITFLDVDMPEISGLDVADLIYKNTAIIFTTGHAGYAVEGFDKNISDFLLKPISFQKFLKSLIKVIGKIEDKKIQELKVDQFFFVNPGSKGRILKINFKDVEHIEALNNYIVIHTPPTNHIIYLTMKEMEAGLPPDKFIRIHKSFIINLDKVTMLEGNIIMIDKLTFPIGVSFKTNLLKRIENYTIKTQR